MADRIRRIGARYPWRHIVHIGGWRHLLTTQGTFFDLLKGLRPKRVVLGRLYL